MLYLFGLFLINNFFVVFYEPRSTREKKKARSVYTVKGKKKKKKTRV
jgi:hypothetical protein